MIKNFYDIEFAGNLLKKGTVYYFYYISKAVKKYILVKK